jgi:IS1 family transposase
MNVLKADAHVRIIAALTEGCSIRSTERLTGAHRDSVMRLGLRVGQGCELVHDAMFRNLNVSILELDELWSFVQKKQKRVQATDPGYMGDCYTWTALDATSKAFVSYRVGKRTSQDCMEFVWDLRTRVLNQCQITSDGYAPYAPAIRAAFGWNVDYAQLRKIFEGDAEGRDAAHRYSPGRVTGIEKEVVFGNPNEKHISTSYVERSNLTVRMSMRRFTRLTNAFSRKPENHAAAFALFVAHYNLCRVHETIRMTPAMALGVTDHIWSIGELVDAALSAAPAAPITPQPIIPGPKRLALQPAPKGTGRVQLRVVRGGKA